MTELYLTRDFTESKLEFLLCQFEFKDYYKTKYLILL